MSPFISFGKVSLCILQSKRARDVDCPGASRAGKDLRPADPMAAASDSSASWTRTGDNDNDEKLA